jgi:hypothetical protein
MGVKKLRHIGKPVGGVRMELALGLQFTDVRIDRIKVGDRYRKDLGNIEELADSIRRNGLLQPIVVYEEGKDDYRLVAGRRRLEALLRLGRKKAEVRIIDKLDPLSALLAERDENTCRKDFTPSEAVALGKELEKLEAEAAKQRQQEGGRLGGQGCGKLPQASKGKTRDKIGRVVGMSGKNYDKAKQVVDAAEADPEQFGPAKDEMDATGKVDPAYQKVREKQGRRRQKREPPHSGGLVDNLYGWTERANRFAGEIKQVLAYDLTAERDYLAAEPAAAERFLRESEALIAQLQALGAAVKDMSKRERRVF